MLRRVVRTVSAILLSELTLTLGTGSCLAEEKTKAANPAVARDGSSLTKPQYHVYAGNCSRSWELRGSYDDLGQACWAASQLRAQKLRVEVTTGNKGPLP